MILHDLRQRFVEHDGLSTSPLVHWDEAGWTVPHAHLFNARRAREATGAVGLASFVVRPPYGWRVPQLAFGTRLGEVQLAT